MNRRSFVLGGSLALASTGCQSLLPVLAKMGQASQYLGSVINVAEDGARAYFARHPSQEREAAADRAIRRARLALAALDAALTASDPKQRAAARTEALKAYSALRALLDSFGVLTATPPLGGAETTAPKPEPFELPKAAEIRF